MALGSQAYSLSPNFAYGRRSFSLGGGYNERLDPNASRSWARKVASSHSDSAAARAGLNVHTRAMASPNGNKASGPSCVKCSYAVW